MDDFNYQGDMVTCSQPIDHDLECGSISLVGVFAFVHVKAQFPGPGGVLI
jgi:hypothetical protein